MAQQIVVQNYDLTWPLKYETEKERILPLLGENAISMYHIGSTSVPGLAAKPVIDIMIVVRSLEKADAAAERFSVYGYEYLGEFGMSGRRYLRKGGDERTHQIHIFRADDWHNIGRHLAFRDYMRTHKKARDEYAEIKKKLAGLFPYDIAGYCQGKEEFVQKMEKTALSRYDGTWDLLYIAARKAQGRRVLSPLLEAGSVAAALLTEQGNIYAGVCIDTACSLGMCAERNAIANMITHGEHHIRRLAVVMPDGRAGLPCGACRELMMQTTVQDSEAEKIQILHHYDPNTAVGLKTLLPDWWGTRRMEASRMRE